MAVITSNEYELNPFPGAPSVAANNQTTTTPTATTPATNQATFTPATQTTTGLVAWGLHPMPKWIETELKRRAKEYGQNPSEQISNYSGPRSAWIRACSNGISAHPLAAGKEGFVLGGIHGFNDSYGFNSSGTIKIGIDVRGNPHEVPVDTLYTRGISGQTRTSKDFPHRPPPSIESLVCELNGANTGFQNLCRKTTIRWKCNSLNQLNYLIPYFFTPGITCLFEWGWNNYDTVSLVDLTDIKWISEMFTIPARSLEWIEKSKGNYDVAIGFVTDYGFKLNELGGYDCYTTIMNSNHMIEGAAIQSRVATSRRNKAEASLLNLKGFSEKYLMSLDTDEAFYVRLRKDLGFVDPTLDPLNNTKSFRERVFRIRNDASPKNEITESSKLWFRMDLVQDIINAFYKSNMDDPLHSPINELSIKNVVMAANRFLKPTDQNVLVPNQYAPRLTTRSEKNTAEKSQVEDATYQNLFKEKLEEITNQNNLTDKLDDLRSVINPAGRSFPVYETLQDSAGPGDWGYLSDIFFNAYTLKQLIQQNNTLLRLLEEILQTINQSLCEICQLKLVSSEYSNGVYSVMDNNMPGVTKTSTASDLVKITLGSLESAFLKNVQFEIKTTSDMQGQIIFQSANLLRNNDRETIVKNIAANPLRFQYSAGDRLFANIDLSKKVYAPIIHLDAAGRPAAPVINIPDESNAAGRTAAPVINIPDESNAAVALLTGTSNVSNLVLGNQSSNIVFGNQSSVPTPAPAPVINIPGEANAAVVPVIDINNAVGTPAPVPVIDINNSVGTPVPNITNETNTTNAVVGGGILTTSNAPNVVGSSASVPVIDINNAVGTPAPVNVYPARSENNTNKFFVYHIDGNPVIGEIRAARPPIIPITQGDFLTQLRQPTIDTRALTVPTKNYILYEKTKDFMNNLLNKPNVVTSYGSAGIMPGTKLTLEFLGISGMSYLSQFVIDHAPETYNYLHAVWQVDDIKQEVVDKNWTTTIVADVRPLIEARRL